MITLLGKVCVEAPQKSFGIDWKHPNITKTSYMYWDPSIGLIIYETGDDSEIEEESVNVIVSSDARNYCIPEDWIKIANGFIALNDFGRQNYN